MLIWLPRLEFPFLFKALMEDLGYVNFLHQSIGVIIHELITAHLTSVQTFITKSYIRKHKNPEGITFSCGRSP